MYIKNIALLTLLSIGVTACDFESVLVTPHYSILYSEDFARRFSLPVEKSVKLDNVHLKAIAISIHRIDRKYECSLNLYYDDSIKLYSPNGQKVFQSIKHNDNFFAKKYNETDFQYNYQALSKNMSPALFRSKSAVVTQTGTATTIGYYQYKEDILPNLNMASLDVACHYLDSGYGEAEVWIKKAGINNYELVEESAIKIKHPENNYRFDIPLALLQSVKPLIDRINAIPVDPAASNVTVQYGVK